MQTFGKRSPFTHKYLENFEQVYNPLASAKQANVGQTLACQNDLAAVLQARVEGVHNILGCTTEVNTEQADDKAAENSLDNCRWRKFSRQFIKDKGDSLDISWLKDNSITDAANLPEPDVLATEAMTELTEALREMNQLMIDLGAIDQAEGQVALLAEEFGLEKKVIEGIE
jgi:type I restriction enzyme M protein